MPFGTILPQEPDWQDSEDEMQQKLESERAGALIEEFIGLDMEEGDAAEIASQENIAQFELGAPNAPLLLRATINLPATISPEMASRELGPLIERTIRESMSEGIADDDYDEFAYIPLSMYTQKHKEKQGLPNPKTPLLGTGELMKQMQPGGWPSEYHWQDSTLTIRWGPNEADDQNPSKKYRDMFFGNPGTGKGHKVKIPRRFPRLSREVQREIRELILNWLRLKQDESAVTSMFTNSVLWTQ